MTHSSFPRWLWYYYCKCILSLAMATNESMETVVNMNASNTFGWITPKGEIIKRIGKPLEIFCTINSTIVEATNYTSSNLKFFLDGSQFDSQNVTKVNETTFSLFLSNKNESKHLYECFLNEDMTLSSTLVLSNDGISGNKENGFNHIGNDQEYGIQLIPRSVPEFPNFIGSVRVVVGEKQRDLVDFRCYSNSVAITMCEWAWPENFVFTNYTFERVPSFTPIEKHILIVRNHSSHAFCVWNHRPVNSKNCCFNLTITGWNTFGTSRWTFIYSLLEHLVPQNIADFSEPGVTSNSITLRWSLKLDEYRPYSVNLTFQICFRKYRELITNWTCLFLTFEEPNEKEKNYEYNVGGLKSNTRYEFSIRKKLSKAPQYEAYWSSALAKTYATKLIFSETEIGLFQILPTSKASARIVEIFWTRMECFDKIENHCPYQTEILKVDEKGDEKLVSDVMYIRPGNTGWLTEFDSANDWHAKFSVGLSPYYFVRKRVNYSGDLSPITINIPAPENERKLCTLFYVVQYANNSYEYIWQTPAKQWGIVNYTLFWHDRFISWIYPLDYKFMNWTYVSSSQSKIPFNFGPSMTGDRNSYENFWKFYISANTENSSSGLRKSMQLVSSVSDFWNSSRFLNLQEESRFVRKKKMHDEPSSKPRINIGRKFTEDQFYGWMHKLHGIEEPTNCKDRRNIIRIRDGH